MAAGFLHIFLFYLHYPPLPHGQATPTVMWRDDHVLPDQCPLCQSRRHAWRTVHTNGLVVNTRLFVYWLLWQHNFLNSLAATTLRNGGNVLIPCYPTVGVVVGVSVWNCMCDWFLVCVAREWCTICWNACTCFWTMLDLLKFPSTSYLLLPRALFLSPTFMPSGKCFQ